MIRIGSAVGALISLVAAGAGPAAQAPSPSPAPQVITSTATAILVDVVVRDRKGRPIADLSAADFQVAEDGIPQTVDSFTRVTRGGGIGVGVAWKAPASTIAVSTSPPDILPAGVTDDEGTTAIVFDHLSPDSLRLAQRATLGYVPMNGEPGGRIGVFATDPGVRILQPYTTDLWRVRRAVAHVAPSSTSADEEKGQRTDELLARRRDLRGETSAAMSGSAGTGQALARNAAVIGRAETEMRLLQTELNMIRSFEHLDRGQRGYDTWRALQAVVESLSEYAGRKTLVFFSEGLPVTPVLSARLDAVIEAANRANVTAYAIDANGLRARSGLTNTRKEMEAFAEERFTQLATGADRTEQPLTMAFERVEDTLRLDSRTGLARLAGDTGGILIEGANDLSSAFRRIDEDNRFHYLLTYSPTNSAFDGKFRRIAVRVARPEAEVFARKGYRAVRAPARARTDGFEAAALALLDREGLPNAFPIHAAGFSFPDPVRPGLTPIVVRVGTGALRFAVDRERSSYSGQASVVVRLRDGDGRDVQTLGQQYVFSGDAGDLEAARRGEIIFYREADLPPGVYTMETIVLDAAAGAGSARIATLTVPRSDPGALGMSSLVLVSKVEEVADAPAGIAGRAPLYVGRSLLYPNVGEPIARSTASELPFYFALYGDARRVAVTAEILRQGRALARTRVPLPDGASRRVQHVGRLPIGALPAGTYELRITVTREGEALSRTAYFTLQD